MKGRILLPFVLLALAGAAGAEEPDARQIVKNAIDHWRGLSSYTVMTMVIHRPDWERSMTMEAWTKGDDRALVRVIEPKKDRGNGTLTDDDSMWTYSPKVNRVIKVPSSMMGQSWMGSDFSNKDISRADDIIDQYEHTLVDTSVTDEIETYTIRSVPHEEAAVVWGKEVLTIRADHVVLEHAFYDQDGQVVKTLKTLEIGDMGGRTIATRQRMQKADEPGEWTEIAVLEVEYDLELRDSLFTLSNLRNPRD
jgi:outer membrane lipoprotein-sorting protein